MACAAEGAGAAALRAQGHEVRVLPDVPLSRGCRCSVEHIRNVLEQFPEEERAGMRNADGVIAVDCEFCSQQFLLAL